MSTCNWKSVVNGNSITNYNTLCFFQNMNLNLKSCKHIKINNNKVVTIKQMCYNEQFSSVPRPLFSLFLFPIGAENRVEGILHAHAPLRPIRWRVLFIHSVRTPESLDSNSVNENQKHMSQIDYCLEFTRIFFQKSLLIN